MAPPSRQQPPSTGAMNTFAPPNAGRGGAFIYAGWFKLYPIIFGEIGVGLNAGVVGPLVAGAMTRDGPGGVYFGFY